jgi:hypothetical protein
MADVFVGRNVPDMMTREPEFVPNTDQDRERDGEQERKHDQGVIEARRFCDEKAGVEAGSDHQYTQRGQDNADDEQPFAAGFWVGIIRLRP